MFVLGRVFNLFIAHKHPVKVKRMGLSIFELPQGSISIPAVSLTLCKFLVLPKPLFLHPSNGVKNGLSFPEALLKITHKQSSINVKT